MMPFDDAGILEAILRTDLARMMSHDVIGWLASLFS
jgi:hypothetical protein